MTLLPADPQAPSLVIISLFVEELDFYLKK